MVEVWNVVIKSSSKNKGKMEYGMTEYRVDCKTIIDVTRVIGTYKVKRGYEIDEIIVRKEMRLIWEKN